MSLKTTIVESFQIIKDEVSNAKEIKDKNLEKFKMIYGIGELVGKVYANKFNVILDNVEDYEKLKYVINSTVLTLDVPEYGLGIFIFRHINDKMLGECI